jgi:hypothetical protein
MTRVAICVPSGDMVHADFAMSLAALIHHCGPIKHQGETLEAIDVAILNVKDSLVANGRNRLVEEALKLDVDYLFFADSDMVLHPWSIRHLLGHERDIVGATYVQRVAPHYLLGKGLDGKPLAETMQSATVQAGELMEVAGLPFGCVLIKMSVVKELCDGTIGLPFQTPQFYHEEAKRWLIEGEDYFFCRVARAAGFSVWLDWSLSFHLRHIGQAANCIPAHQIEKDGEHVH